MQCKRDLGSSGMLRSVYLYFVTDVSGQPIASIFKTLEGRDRLSRNVGSGFPIYAS